MVTKPNKRTASPPLPPQLFLDSGAFSAWSQGVEIDIDDYISFIKENEKYLFTYVNLDVIGDPVKTYENQKYMERAGLNPIPVFHTTMEPLSWLEKYLDEGYEYIGLGGMAGGTVDRLSILRILDVCFATLLCHPDGIPRVKVHGFGMTSHLLMFRYPWYSVDSTSWVLTSRMGGLFVPKLRGGEWLYTEAPWKIDISNRSSSITEAGKHFSSFSPKEQDIILSYCSQFDLPLGKSEFRVEPSAKKYTLQSDEQWDGKLRKDGSRSVEVVLEPGLSNSYQFRDILNIHYYLELEKHFPEWPWPFKLGKRVKGFMK